MEVPADLFGHDLEAGKSGGQDLGVSDKIVLAERGERGRIAVFGPPARGHLVHTETDAGRQTVPVASYEPCHRVVDRLG